MDDDLIDLLDDEPAPSGPQPIQGWLWVATLASMLAAGTLLGAGTVLSEQGLGGAATRPGCDGGLAVGLLLLVLAGALVGLVRIVVDRRYAQEIVFDNARFLALVPVPALGLILATPAFVGCDFAVDIANMELIGGALSGTPGIAVAGACAFAVGLAASATVRLRTPLDTIIAHYELAKNGPPEPDAVERALAQTEGAPQRFDTQTGEPLEATDPGGYDLLPPMLGAHPVSEPTLPDEDYADLGEQEEE